MIIKFYQIKIINKLLNFLNKLNYSKDNKNNKNKIQEQQLLSMNNK